METPKNEAGNSNMNNDSSNWFLGMFYYNPADKRLLPPKRIKWLGWTINFANPFSILSGIAVIAVIVVSAKFVKGWYIHF